MSWLLWLENSPLSIWLKESPSILAYPVVLFFHAIGLAFTAGPSAVISLRLLGMGRQLPVKPFERFFSVIWIGFWTATASGLLMLAADATTKLANPVFAVKMVFVALSVALMMAVRRMLTRQDAGDRQPGGLRWLAAASLICWLGVIGAGRFMAYF